MSFISDALRVAGVVVAPVLVATGVGAPLAIAIGSLTAGAGNAGADAIDRNRENNQADGRAEQAKQEADAQLEQQLQVEKSRRRQVEKDLQRREEQAAIPQRILDICRSGNLRELAPLLGRLTNDQLEQLGFSPLSACPNATVRASVQEALANERMRRRII